jgi:N-acetylneuraminic acid mutarotase
MVQSCGDRMGDWRHEAPLPTARSYLAATCGEDEDSLYAIGGFEGSLGMRYLATVERYSASRDEWVECPGIEGGRSHLAAATLRNGSNGSSVFALGGYSDGRAWADVERFDAGRGAWVKEAAMPTARDSLAAVALGARLFALGGCVEGGVTNLATVEALDPRVGKWHAEASMPSVRALLSAAVVGERLFVLGGNSSKLGSNFNAVHSLDPRVNKWEEEAPMLSSRIGAAIAVL